MARSKIGGRFRVVLGLAIAVGVAWVGLGAFRTGPPPTVRIAPSLPAIGRATPVTITVEEPTRGLAGVRVELVQGDTRETLESRDATPRPPWAFWGPRNASETFTVEVGKNRVPALKQGHATVRVTAERAGSWLRHPDPVVEEAVLPVRLIPPTLGVRSTATYVAQGGCEAVVYVVGESAVKDGVQAGDRFFTGYPLPGGSEATHFALFGVPYDLDDPSKIRLVAEDDVGNRSELAFVDRFFPKPIARDTIPVTDEFMQRVVPAILAQTPDLEDKGDLLQNYLEINNRLRARDQEELDALGEKSRPEFLWSRPFLAMPNTKVMSRFADRRTYVYDGRTVDHQTHLGFDLASVRNADVPAANDGVVVMARYFGIYGNAVVLDHGYGLMSLYGHLSTIAVADGDRVERGQTIGTTGATGLAGGDHLHFSMLLRGMPVNPGEWWDGHWIRDRLERKLGAALPFHD